MQLRPSILVLSLLLSLGIACGGDDSPVADPDTGDLSDVDTDAGDIDEPDVEPDVEPREGPVALAPDEVRLSGAAGQSVQGSFDIENAGTESLSVNVLSPSTGLRVTPSSQQVAPGQAGTFNVSANCPATGTGNYASDLTINTNDPENQTFALTVRLICGDATPGSLQVTIEGLDEGLTPVLTLRAEDGAETPVVGEERVEDLEPGDYTLIASPVVEGLRTYTAEDVALTIESDAQTDVTLTFALVTASWELVVNGLPAGLDADITVDGPEDIGPLTGSQTFDDLTPGVYTLTPEPLTQGPALYRGEPIEVELASGDDVRSELFYSLMFASLDLTVEGLPAGANANITITGPEGFETTLNGDEQLNDLIPGDYEIVAADVTTGGVTYSATGTTAALVSEQTTPAVITYVAPATTLMLSYDLGDAGSYTLEVVGASDSVVATRTLSGQGSEAIEVDPGTYSVRASSAPTDTWGNVFYITGAQDVLIPESNIVSASVEAVAPTLVTRTDDAGQGSLREVIGRVNAGSVVTFAPGVDQVEVTGSQISLNRDISIIGNGRETTAIVGVGSPLRLFSVTAGDLELLFQDLTLRGARGEHNQGGAIYNQADLTLFNVHFDDNRGSSGGALANAPSGSVTANEVLFTNNQASQRGGAIHNAGALNIDQALFANNSAQEHGGAIFAPFNGGGSGPLAHTHVSRALFELNTAPDGGAISVSSVLRVENATFDANDAEGDGGAIFVSNFGTAEVNFSTFSGNDASRGAAVLLDGSASSSLKVSRSIFASNTIEGAAGAQLARVSTESAIVSGGDNFISAADLADIDEDPTDTIGLLASPLASPLATLADNGGFTRTIEVVEASQAELSITEARCLDLDDALLTLDQRGESRPFEGLCTVGAWQLAPPSGPFTETFDNLVLTGTSYTSGSFVGVNGITWNYTGARNESGFEIDGNGILFRDSGSYVRATIPGGVNEVSVDYRKGFTGGGNRQLEIRVNGEVVATSPSFGSASGRDDTIYTLSVDTLGLTGDVVVEIRTITNNQIVFDNITWN